MQAISSPWPALAPPRWPDIRPALTATDARGTVTHHNQACIAFAGRTPRVGHDLWCVTWRLYTEEGEFLPHDQCPMAVAIRERRAVRDVEAIAERPDGTHVQFRPYPTPLLDDGGNLVGAVNLLLDVTGRERARALRTRAARCRRLVNLMPGRRSVEMLHAMAQEYDREASGIEQADDLDRVLDSDRPTLGPARSH